MLDKENLPRKDRPEGEKWLHNNFFKKSIDFIEKPSYNVYLREKLKE